MNLRTLELINLDIDGRLAGAECDELEALLAADPAARARHAELQALGRALAEAPAPALPADFRDAVMRRVRMPDAQRGRRLAGRSRRVVFALAASALLAALAFGLLERPQGPPEQMAGTLARPDSVAASDIASFAVQPVAGGLLVNFDLPSGPLADLVISFKGAGPLTLAPDQSLAAQVEPGRIVLSGIAGGKLEVRLAGSAAPEQLTASLVRDGVSRPLVRALQR